MLTRDEGSEPRIKTNQIRRDSPFPRCVKSMSSRAQNPRRFIVESFFRHLDERLTALRPFKQQRRSVNVEHTSRAIAFVPHHQGSTAQLFFATRNLEHGRHTVAYDRHKVAARRSDSGPVNGERPTFQPIVKGRHVLSRTSHVAPSDAPSHVAPSHHRTKEVS